MASWADVRRIALSLPETDEHGSYRGAPSWRVRGKGFVWDRPLGRKDVADLAGAAPTGPVLGARVADEGEKRLLIEEDPAVFFTIPHFDGYPAVLIRLDTITRAVLRETTVEAWLLMAPVKLGKLHEDSLVAPSLPPGIGRPATGALVAAGFYRPEELDGVPAKELLALHGVGPKAIRILTREMSARGLALT